VGDGPYRSELEAHFAGTNTHFVGYLHGEDLAAAYASADAFVFPSRTETLGLVLLEAMAAGCPVIAANAGGIPDIVTDGVNGFLFDTTDDDGMVAAAARLLGDRSKQEQLGKAARAEAERWSWAAATLQLAGYYDRILGVEMARAA
jgi:glycosyltransferase involved in cell wall biosynthesis